jgi:hypothetical protein
MDPTGLFISPGAHLTLSAIAMVLTGRKSAIETSSPVILSLTGVGEVAIASGLIVASTAALKLYQDWYFERGLFAKKPKNRGGSGQMPSWVPRIPLPGETPTDYAEEMMKYKYGKNWRATEGTGPASEHNWLKKGAEDRKRLER